MGWSHIPNMDTAALNSDNNPFAGGPKLQPAGNVFVCMPTLQKAQQTECDTCGGLPLAQL